MKVPRTTCKKSVFYLRAHMKKTDFYKRGAWHLAAAHTDF